MYFYSSFSISSVQTPKRLVTLINNNYNVRMTDKVSTSTGFLVLTVIKISLWFDLLSWMCMKASRSSTYIKRLRLGLWWNSDFSPKMMKMFYSLVIRQAQWNITLQKHANIILKSTILCYPHKVSLKDPQANFIQPFSPWCSAQCLFTCQHYELKYQLTQPINDNSINPISARLAKIKNHPSLTFERARCFKPISRGLGHSDELVITWVYTVTLSGGLGSLYNPLSQLSPSISDPPAVD